MIEHKDIVISGGGIAGLVAAVAFGNAGLDVLCVEPTSPILAKNTPAADLRTTAYLQPSQAFLQEIGVWPLVEIYSTPLQVMRVVDAANADLVIKDFNARDISAAPFGWNVGNWHMRDALLERINTLSNVVFVPGLASTKVNTRSSGARVTMSDGQIIICKLLIAADGRDSTIRSSAGIAAKSTDFGQLALSFAVTHAMAHKNISTEVHKAGGPFTLIPLPDFEGKPSSAVVWMDKVANIQEMQVLEIDEFNTKITARSAGVLGHLNLVTARTAWPIISQLADRFYSERIALIAEAAHVVPPIGAQGLNLSLGDIQTLLQLVEAYPNTIGDAIMLKKYDRARRPLAQSRVIGVGMLNSASKAEGQIVTRTRAIGLEAIHRIEPLRKALMHIGLGSR